VPELPEVETTRRGIAPHLLGRWVEAVVVREHRLRWPVPADLPDQLVGRRIASVERRAKYLLVGNEIGAAILHLGMSGNLRVLPAGSPLRPHDHVDIVLDDGHCLRFNDPRRFGCLLWQPLGQVDTRLASLGPEPFDERFDGRYLYRLSRGRSAPVKTFLMDQAVVVGVGNIYAAEALHIAGIAPWRAAGRVSLARYGALAAAVRTILDDAIERGGTTLRDFLRPDGEPGYFEQELMVYGREGQDCKHCGSPLRAARIGQRASVWCPRCQR
jgi:formamidopyrimidine-DNA glycosylase